MNPIALDIHAWNTARKEKTALRYAKDILKDADKFSTEHSTTIKLCGCHSPAGYLRRVADEVASLLFASGYWATVSVRTRKNKVNMIYEIQRMTDDEYQNELAALEEMGWENPEN
jgi:hypothetical protein